jgi:hypothetical protein
MMFLPFFTLAAAIVCAMYGKSKASKVLWALSVVGTLVLFRMHATDALSLSF